MRLKGKLAVITAGASGMGKAAALLFAREGAAVAIVDINGAAAIQVANEIGAAGGTAYAIHADLSNAQECRGSINEAARSLGGIDIFWAHAGIPGTDVVEDVDLAEYELSMAVNVRSCYLTVGEAVKHIRKRGGGSVILAASIAGLVGSLLSPLYSAGKFAVVGLGKSLSLRYGPEQIRINVICPGLTATPMLREFMGRGSSDEQAVETQKKFMTMIPLARLAQPEDIAKTALFLASDDSAYITGVAIPVDGGFTAK
ncbi:MAG: family oxidoreductase [Rhodospirillales bacterium]|nr:family oxidoreductase [Rhodospirillales bacterium]